MTTTTDRVVPFTAGDGMALNLVNVRGDRAPTKGPVMLVHGAGVRANIFRAPVERTVVDALLDDGYDVWLENWRASIDFPANEWTLDQRGAARPPGCGPYGRRRDRRRAGQGDHPLPGVDVVRHVGGRRAHPGGHDDHQQRRVVPPRRAVVVTPQGPLRHAGRGPCAWTTSIRVPATAPRTARARALTLSVRATHHECQNTVCKLGELHLRRRVPGPVAPREHQRRHPRRVHPARVRQGAASASSARSPAASARATWCRIEPTAGLPADYAAQPVKTDARFVLFAGRRNQCFLPDSQEATYHWLDAQRPGFHGLHVLDTYSHLDIFMGERAATDVFPIMLARARALSRGRFHALPEAGPVARRPLRATSTASRSACRSGPAPARRCSRPSPSTVTRPRPSCRATSCMRGGSGARGVLVLAVVNYQDTTIGRYVEFCVGVLATRGRAPVGALRSRCCSGPTTAPASTSTTCPSAARSRSRAGSASGACRSAMPTSTSSSADKTVSSQYDLDGKLVARIDIPRPASPGSRPDEGRRLGCRLPRAADEVLHLQRRADGLPRPAQGRPGWCSGTIPRRDR